MFGHRRRITGDRLVRWCKDQSRLVQMVLRYSRVLNGFLNSSFSGGGARDDGVIGDLVASCPTILSGERPSVQSLHRIYPFGFFLSADHRTASPEF
jgi:hypothetical protein